MTDQTRTEALRKCRLFVEHCIQTGNTFAVGEALLKEIDAALSHSQAQGVTITDEMVERASRIHDPLSWHRIDFNKNDDDWNGATAANLYNTLMKKMHAALEAALSTTTDKG